MGEGEMPEEIILSNAVSRYGANGVFGRPLSALEIERMGTANGIVSICHDRNASLNHATWATENPEAAKVFDYAMKLALDMGLIKDPN